MLNHSFLLYGANGYSGKLIARFAHKFGLVPILAGRNETSLQALASETGYAYRIADVNDANQLRAILQDCAVVVNAAGPFDRTAEQIVAACLETKKHYIDLNGDTAVFEMLQGYNERAIAAGIMIMPGAGFDVVPTDCLSVYLAGKMPDAVQLEIAFAIKGSTLSHGTAITTAERLGLPGAVRAGGKITEEPVGKRGRCVDFTPWNESAFVMSIPWGDISTAWYSTRIPNITTYTAISKASWRLLKFQWLFNWLLRTRFMRKRISRLIDKRTTGPGDAQRDKAISLIRASVQDKEGKTLTAFMRCPEAYSLTADAALLIASKILDGDFKPGYQTPATAYGSELVMEIPGVERIMG